MTKGILITIREKIFRAISTLHHQQNGYKITLREVQLRQISRTRTQKYKSNKVKVNPSLILGVATTNGVVSRTHANYPITPKRINRASTDLGSDVSSLYNVDLPYCDVRK